MSSTLSSRSRRQGAVEPRPGGRRDRDRKRRRGERGTDRGRVEEVTLESKLLLAWAALAAGHPIECPGCGGAYTAEHGCRNGCGASLS